MDQKRTLWITIAAGIFLLVVVGAALILYAPAAKRETTVASLGSKDIWVSPTTIPSVPKDNFAQGTASPAGTQETTPSASPVESQPASTEPAPDGTYQTDNLTVIANGTTNVIGLGETNTPGTTTIDLNELKNTSTNVTANNTVAQNAMQQTATAHKTTAITEAPVTQEKPKSTVSAKPVTPAKKPVASAKPAEPKPAKLADQFWVQAASYSTKKNADEARDTLESNKIQCEVFTYKDAKGKLFYRVRVGPYTTKSEATYWKEKIDTIDLFAKTGSYITNSSAAKK